MSSTFRNAFMIVSLLMVFVGGIEFFHSTAQAAYITNSTKECTFVRITPHGETKLTANCSVKRSSVANNSAVSPLLTDPCGLTETTVYKDINFSGQVACISSTVNSLFFDSWPDGSSMNDSITSYITHSYGTKFGINFFFSGETWTEPCFKSVNSLAYPGSDRNDAITAIDVSPSYGSCL